MHAAAKRIVMKKLLLFYLCAACASAYAQSPDFSSTGYSAGAADYLKLPYSAHSAALSGAVCAWREDLTGAQYNPAIINAASEGALYIDAAYTIMTLDRKHISVAGAGTLTKYLAWGASFVNYGVGNIEGRDTFGVLTDNFNYNENALALSLAGSMLWNISAGATVRYLFESMYTERANGVGFDAGATWQPVQMLTIGLAAQNLLSTLWWSTSHADPVLPSARLGIAGSWLKNSIRAEIDLSKTSEQPEELCFGAQYTLLEIISLRGGISTAIDASSMHSKYPDYSFGLGMRYSGFGFDFACLIPDSDLGMSYKFSLVAALKDVFR
jgi:hypothetical protein